MIFLVHQSVLTLASLLSKIAVYVWCLIIGVKDVQDSMEDSAEDVLCIVRLLFYSNIIINVDVNVFHWFKRWADVVWSHKSQHHDPGGLLFVDHRLQGVLRYAPCVMEKMVTEYCCCFSEGAEKWW